MSDCIFCKIINAKILTKLIYEDEYLVVFHDINPKASVHVLIVPKEHIKDLNEINDVHGQLIKHIMMSLPKIASLVGLDGGFRTIINTGKDSGQEIEHLHVHILGGAKGTKLPGF